MQKKQKSQKTRIALTDAQIRDHLLANGWEEPWINARNIAEARRIMEAKPKSVKGERQ
jgi:hypothetical protein